MIIFKSKIKFKSHLQEVKNQQQSIGFVPTMGALHKGHISLIEKAKTECDVVIASIFVNPTQFNNLSDLDKYPRTFEQDCEILIKAGCDILFAPEISEMYSKEEIELKQQNIEDKSWAKGKTVDFGSLANVMEGLRRPGHFNGVVQIVSKLFRVVEPNRAYFGQKDFQQLMIIKKMAQQLEMPIEIVACPIVRDQNGLAMSSRNKRLSLDEKEKAALISKTLFNIKALQNEKSISELKAIAIQQLKAGDQFEVEYFEISDIETLQPVTSPNSTQQLIVCVALRLGEVRLIDNIILSPIKQAV